MIMLGSGMRFIVVLLILIAGIATHAQTGWEYFDDSPERLIGLLDLEDIVRGGCGTVERATARAFSTPSETSPIAGTIYWREQGDTFCGLMFERTSGGTEVVPTMESGYEIPAAIVYERRGQWFRIRLLKGSAWIRRTNAADFLAYPDMLREHLTYILQGWDGTLHKTHGTSAKVRPLTSGWKALLDRGLSVEYLGSRRVGNDPWVHIRLAPEGACDQKYDGVTPVDGWIPAYRANRSPSVWFSSRGC